MPTLLDRDFKAAGMADASKRRPRRRWHILMTLAILVPILGVTLGTSGRSNSQATPLNPTQDGELINTGDALQRELAIPAPAPAEVGQDDPQQDFAEFTHHEWAVASGDSLSAIFDRLSIPQKEMMALVALEDAEKTMRRLKPGDRLQMQVDDDSRLVSLMYAPSPHSRKFYERIDGSFQVREEQDPIETRLHYAQGVIEDSLFLAATEAGLDDSMTMELATIFGWDIDFALDVRSGDSFAVVYEARYKNGEHIANGAILAAEFINQGTPYRAIRFQPSEGRTDYFTPEGKSVRKAFLRTPVDFARISSRFSLGRKHPVLNRMRAHRGVDYAAPTGTPIRSTGDGKVEFVGTKGGYGKVVIVRHTSSYSTLYAHMSRFKGGIRAGKRVQQGQIIGYVGQSGLATGPHLHYEFLVNGVQRNPLTVKLPGATPVARNLLDEFVATAKPMLAQLDTIARNSQALQAAQADSFD